MARTSAAKPAADDARPAAVGKLFSDTSFRFMVLNFGRVGSAASRVERRVRSSRRQACVRAPEMSWASPLRIRLSEV